MDELSPGARALLDAADGIDDPAHADAERIRALVMAKVAGVSFGAALMAIGLERARALLAMTMPKFAAVILLALGSSAVYPHFRRHAAAPELPAVSVTSKSALQRAEPAPTASAPAATDASPALVPSVVAALPVSRGARQASTLEAEMRWVRSADAALRAGNVALAVSLLNQHAREFPHGALLEEREGLLVVAACQKGESAAVQRAASAFLTRAPRSLMVGRVRAACLGG